MNELSLEVDTSHFDLFPVDDSVPTEEEYQAALFVVARRNLYHDAEVIETVAKATTSSPPSLKEIAATKFLSKWELRSKYPFINFIEYGHKISIIPHWLPRASQYSEEKSRQFIVAMIPYLRTFRQKFYTLPLKPTHNQMTSVLKLLRVIYLAAMKENLEVPGYTGCEQWSFRKLVNGFLMFPLESEDLFQWFWVYENAIVYFTYILKGMIHTSAIFIDRYERDRPIYPDNTHDDYSNYYNGEYIYGMRRDNYPDTDNDENGDPIVSSFNPNQFHWSEYGAVYELDEDELEVLERNTVLNQELAASRIARDGPPYRRRRRRPRPY